VEKVDLAQSVISHYSLSFYGANTSYILQSLLAKDKNLAIANRSRFSCTHNTLRASIGLNITP